MNTDNRETANCNKEMRANSLEIANSNEENPNRNKEMKISIKESRIGS